MGEGGDSQPSGKLDHQASNQYSQKNISHKSRKELNKHNRAEHVGERAFPCSMCENAFCSKQSLSYHVKKVHRNVLTDNRSGGRLYIATGLAASGLS